MSQRNKQTPTTWEAVERGRASSFGSLESINEDQPQESYAGSPFASRTNLGANDQDGQQDLRRRRSSIAMRFNSIRQLGGPNSIDNFAKSFQRAAGFHQITPVRRGSITMSSGDENEDEEEADGREHQGRAQNKSLLGQQLQGAGSQSQIESGGDEDSSHPENNETSSLLRNPSHVSFSIRSRLQDNNLGTSYGSISSRLTPSAQRRASILIQQQVEASKRMRDDPDEPDDFKDDLAQRQVEIETRDDGEVIERIVGESTVPMTVFNSTNVLIGVGILALPLAVRYSGWVLGIIFLTLSALVTSYTAKLLARCLDTNSASTTYGDIAFLAFDSWGRASVEFLFIIELLAANVALIILFADSMNSLMPSISTPVWKAILSIGLMPLNFVPFKTLSISSVLGIACMLGIILIVVTDGLLKPHSPGSLREVATTYAFPANYKTIPLSLGLFMSPWGGHSVFPAIYKDMRHPQKYPRAVRTTYLFTYGLDLTMAILGYLMFGEFVQDEVTSNILRASSKHYPHILSIIIVILIAIIPVTKIPLSNRPIMDTINKKFLIDLRQMDAKARAMSKKSWTHRTARATIAITANIVELGVAILLPDFDSIMALMGSALCFTICVILPILFYLKLFHGSGEIKLPERVLCWVLVVISVILGIIGTVFALIPKEKIGAASCAGKIGCL